MVMMILWGLGYKLCGDWGFGMKNENSSRYLLVFICVDFYFSSLCVCRVLEEEEFGVRGVMYIVRLL